MARGAPAATGFSQFYYRGERLLAAEAVNRPGDYMGAKKVMEQGRTIDPALVQDMSKTMKEIVAASQ